METPAAFLVDERIDDIRREVDAARLARAVSRSRRARAAWRRLTGTAARRLGSALEDIAVWLDPAVRRPSYGRE